MYTVGEMRRALAGLDDLEPLAVVFFTKGDAEDNCDSELTKAEWAFAADLFHRDELVDKEATEAIRTYIYQAQRAKV